MKGAVSFKEKEVCSSSFPSPHLSLSPFLSYSASIPQTPPYHVFFFIRLQKLLMKVTPHLLILPSSLLTQTLPLSPPISLPV
jgi:hypothetical protein